MNMKSDPNTSWEAWKLALLMTWREQVLVGVFVLISIVLTWQFSSLYYELKYKQLENNCENLKDKIPKSDPYVLEKTDLDIINREVKKMCPSGQQIHFVINTTSRISREFADAFVIPLNAEGCSANRPNGTVLPTEVNEIDEVVIRHGADSTLAKGMGNIFDKLGIPYELRPDYPSERAIAIWVPNH